MSYLEKISNYIKFLLYWLKCIVSTKAFIEENNKVTSTMKQVNIPKKIAIIVHPWLMTPTPFFSIATGLFLSKRGNQVDIVIDDLTFGKSTILYKLQILSIKYVSRFIPKKIKVFAISELKPLADVSIVTDKYLESLSSQNAVHYMKGELKIEGRKEYKNRIYNQLYKSRPYVYSFMSESNYDSIHLSGGIYSDTGVYLKYAKHFKIRANTFDAGFGVLVASTNGTAAQLSDIPYGVSLLKTEINEDEFELIEKFSIDQIEQRKAGTDIFGFLDSGIDSSLLPIKVGALILLNSVWDSAALGIHHVYNGYVEWLISTTEFILTNTESHVTIRQHPGEKLDYQTPNDDLKTLLREKFGENNRILFVDCNSKINTYQLMEASDLVICFSSTSGIESAILGKKVIVASNCYYSNERFVLKPKSLEDYHDLIQNAIASSSASSDDISEAILFYYLGQCCNWVFTDFTPMPDDFKKWVKVPGALRVSPEVEMYLRSIEENLPVSLLIARNKIKEFQIL